MYQKAFIIFSILLINIKISEAQNSPNIQSYAPRDYTIIPPSPEVSTLFQYEEIPVDYFNGIPEISFELFRITKGTLSVPITLSYHGGGIRLNDKEGNAGLGWIVSSGACISRTIYGIPDETNGGLFKAHGLFHLNADEKAFRQRLISKIADYDPCDAKNYQNNLSWQATLGKRYSEGLTDVANDIFQLSGLGLSGTFIYNDNKNLVLSSEDPIEISPKQCTNYYPGTFTIKNSIGTTYTFGITEQTKYTYSYGEPTLEQQKDSIRYTSTWHISSITDACGNQINFIYDTSPGYEWTNSISESVMDISNPELKAYAPKNISSLNTIVYYPKLLRKIQTSGITVEFEYTIETIGFFRKTLISSISIKTLGNDDPVKKYEFIYDDIPNSFSDGSDEFFDTWKILSKVRENGNDIYRFGYNTSTDGIYNNYYAACDFGGYFNGKNNIGLVPSYLTKYKGHGANRSIVPDAAKIGVLKTIYHPTGGFTNIEWESNEFGYIQNTKLNHHINDAVISESSTDTLRMCYEPNYKKLKLSNYIVHNGQEITLDLTKYFLMNPANLMTTDYEISHEFEAENYNSANPPHYPHITIRNSFDNTLVAAYFIDKETIEKYHNEPIHLSLTEGIYDFELLHPISVDGAEDFLQTEFKYSDSPAGRIFITKNIYSVNGSTTQFNGKDFWCGLRVKRIISNAKDDADPLIKDFLYGDLDPNVSDGVIQVLPRYNHSYYMSCPSPFALGEDGTDVIVISSTAFSNTPIETMSQIQYPIVTTRLSKPDRFEPDSYLNQRTEQFRYSSSYDLNNSDYISTDFYAYQPIGARMYTSRAHRRGNLQSKRVGGAGYYGNQTVSYTYNIFEPDELDTFTTDAFVISDFSHYTGVSKYGTCDYGIGKYSLIPYNKTIASETLTEGSGFSYMKTYQYFYDTYTDNLDYNLIKSETFINSEGEEEKTYYTYLKIDKFYTPLVETEIHTCADKIVSAVRNEYDPNTLLLKKKFTLNTPVSSTTLLLSSDQRTTTNQIQLISKPEYEYQYNEMGNIVQISFNGIVLASYLWGYHGEHPILEISGVGINEILPIAANVGFSQKEVLDGIPYDESQIKSIAQAIRSKFPEANVVSLTYHWLIGIMESTDARGISTSFNYDNLGRLTEVRDMNNFLINKYDYHCAWEALNNGR